MSRLTHDINQYGVMIHPKANTTLKAMTKDELIEYIRTLEHNYNVAVDFNERQARNVEAELKKWQHYKDLEEQGRLIELPCKVGDTVYVIENTFDNDCTTAFIAEYELVEITYDGKLWTGEFYQFGKEAFTTKEEAGAKLAELKGE